MVTLQDMALAYLNNVGEQIKQQEEFIARHSAQLDQLKQHFAECEERLAKDTSEKLGMIGQPPVIKTKEPVTFNSPAPQDEEPSINDQYK